MQVCVFLSINSTPKLKQSKILYRVTLSSSLHKEGFFKIHAFDRSRLSPFLESTWSLHNLPLEEEWTTILSFEACNLVNIRTWLAPNYFTWFVIIEQNWGVYSWANTTSTFDLRQASSSSSRPSTSISDLRWAPSSASELRLSFMEYVRALTNFLELFPWSEPWGGRKKKSNWKLQPSFYSVCYSAFLLSFSWSIASFVRSLSNWVYFSFN